MSHNRDTDIHADKTMPFRIGSNHCPGFSKVVEEFGEVNQVIGKIQGFGGFGVHWDGQDLRQALEKELADALASIRFVVESNGLNEEGIRGRASMKLNRFHQWHNNIQNDRPPNEGVVYED